MVAGPGRRGRGSRCADKLYAPEEISALVLRKLADDAGEVPRREGHRGGDHRAGVLQRRAAAGDQGRRPDRRARGAADHQRADRGRAGLRAGQEAARDGAGVRPRRRHVRRQHPRRRRRRRRGAGHRRRHPPRRRRLRPAARRLPGRRVPEGATASTCARTRRRCSGCSRRPRRPRSSCRSVTQTQVNLPFITADANGPKHLKTTLMRSTFEQITADLRRAVPGPGRAGDGRRQGHRRRHRRGHPGRRLDPDPGRAEPGAPADRRQGPEHDRQPGRGRRARRRDPGRRSSRARSRTSCCSTSRRCRWAWRPWAG